MSNLLYPKFRSNLALDARELAYQRSRELCAEAKKLSLSAWFEQQGAEVKFERNRHYTTWCPAPGCGESGKGNRKVFITDDAHFKCYACKEGGDIVDAEIYLTGATAAEAAASLLGVANDRIERGQVIQLRQQQDQAAKLRQQEAERQKQSAVAQVIGLIAEATSSIRDEAAIQYLTGTAPGERGLPRQIVEEAIERNILRLLPSNMTIASAMIRSIVPESLLRAAGLWKDDSKGPWVAYRPIWFIGPGGVSAELRIARRAREGESKSVKIGPKHRPYYWQGTNPLGCATVEGGMDMLALVALGYQGDILALQGVNNWDMSWFPKMQATRGTQRFDIMFDNDDEPGKKNHGQIAAQDLGAELGKNGIAWNNVLLPSGDINDHWLRKLAQS